jgi:hypothetical protein
MNLLAQFLAYANKVFHLNRLVRTVRDRRPYPVIPTRPVVVCLLLAAVLRVDSYLAAARQTKRRRWRRLSHWGQPLSDDTLAHVAERLQLEDLRQTLAAVARQLKTNKALESCKINGLLWVSLDANEHFAGRSRCCPDGCQRPLTETDAGGRARAVIEYYHRYVFAQINGPKLNVVLDLEPIRPGEGEAAAALRLLGRLRRVYGPRFFDAVTIDAWYVQGPFLQAVTKLGWDWVVVLKQAALAVFQEARALSQGQKPQLAFHDPVRQRDVQLWAVDDLTLSDTYPEPVRVVHACEQWTDRKIIGGRKTTRPQSSDWWWIASPRLHAYPVTVVYHAGHRRWGLENKAFNELTQGYHLEHCYHHEPVAMLAQMLILLLGFVLFNAFAALHCQPLRRGQMSLKELAHQLDLALEEDLPWDPWFACGETGGPVRP